MLLEYLERVDKKKQSEQKFKKYKIFFFEVKN